MDISILVGIIMIEVPVQRHRIIHETRFLVGYHIIYDNFEWERVFDAPNSYNFVNAFNECIPKIIEIVKNLTQVCGYTLNDVTLNVQTDNPYIVRLMNGEECPRIELLEHYKKAMRALSKIDNHTVKYISFNKNQSIYRRLEREKREKIMNDIYNETN
jgi:hypothetical protein